MINVPEWQSEGSSEPPGQSATPSQYCSSFTHTGTSEAESEQGY